MIPVVLHPEPIVMTIEQV